jgi:hypothetical protein
MRAEKKSENDKNEGSEPLKDSHLAPKDVRLLMKWDREEVFARLLLHLLRVCPECRAVGGFILEGVAAGKIDEKLVEGIWVELCKSRLDAPALWEELESELPEERKAIVKTKKPFCTWGLTEFLCERTLERAPHDPAAALAAAELAVEVGMRIPGWADGDWNELLRGYAWAHLVHARRRSGDLPGAWQAFVRAKEIWEPAFANYGDVLKYEERFSALMAGNDE